MATMMKCGHAANAVRSSDQAPVCAICAGVTVGYDEPVETPSMEGRVMICTYARRRDGSSHGAPRPSDPNGAFFEMRAGTEADPDRYYCGCWGWD